MLRTRILTALALLAVLLPALFYPAPHPFIALALVAIAAASWEWARLNGLRGAAAVACGGAVLLVCGIGWWQGVVSRPLPLVWMASGAAWVLAGAWLLRRGVGGWPGVPRAVRLVGGLVALCVTWLAVAQARTLGVNLLLSILVLVWMADVAAYFAGRALGGRFTNSRLAPAISPNKSWEGVWGGMLGVVLLAFCWAAADQAAAAAVPSLYSRLLGVGWWMLVLGAVFLAAMSVLGDLVESLVKRSAGAKDSSRLLPGHGGVLDRVDALLPVLPLAMMLVSLAEVR